ncbi:cyclin-dependent kinases regulatory subunit-like [Ixodes scapularis]|uniref:Cyclin-dependent kinases regulatory subunit n=1 Tax=Ixodes scapularis TaxID=6945 RepID=B7Q8G6_IXOSC|nr:cyclin-dependent kinases regulatory subunit [Ixodes scapularis]XP_042144879.1 cyclin-dependent kinases regulatory subunit-like [Ixodes scapularis]EEC15138.1 cyclin-dependent kinase regulatory subunit, putative [Ixodes scapularis]|eukprot:XP_002412359.1 cyclin-dependent kinase regulatory subunit, putative [Ixodes scapularis]
MAQKNIYYSDKYYDDKYEYRHVVLPKEIAKLVPKSRLMSETEWRGIGVQQSHGWVHYMIHEPEPHILLFRRAVTPTELPSQEEQMQAELCSQ